MNIAARSLAVATALFAIAACGADNKTASMSSGGTTPPPTQETLANAPSGTVFAGSAHQGIEAFTVVNAVGITASGASALTSDVATPTTTVTTTATGLTLDLPQGERVAVNTVTGSSDITGPNQYTATVVTNPYTQGASGILNSTLNLTLGTALTYSNYGVWTESVNCCAKTIGGPTTSAITAGGVFTYGVLTTAAQMPTAGTASYTGTMTGQWAVPVTPGTLSQPFGGNVSLVANFTNASITGEATILTGPSALTTTSTGDILLTAGTVTGTGFAGTATGDSITGTFGGKFYGPAAAEASGSINLSSGGSELIAAFSTTGGAIITPIPVGTVFTPTPNQGLAAFSIPDAVTVATAGSGTPTPVLDPSPSTMLTTTATGFNLTLPFGERTTINTVAGSADISGANQYTTKITQSPFTEGAIGLTSSTFNLTLSSGLAYSNYGVWTESVTCCGASALTVAAGVFTYGTVTTTAQMPAAGVATYSGHVGGVFSTSAASGTITGGNIALSANFTANIISGEITGLQGQGPLNSLFPGTVNNILLTAGTITGTGFTGTATPIGAATTYDITAASGTFGGLFYGPNATETAGSVELSGGGEAVVAAFGATAGPVSAAPPASTLYIPTAHEGLEALTVPNAISVIFVVADPQTTVVANPVATVSTTAATISLVLPEGEQVTFNTAAGASDIIGANHYDAQTTANPVMLQGGPSYIDLQLAAGLTYASYGVWSENSSENVGGIPNIAAGTTTAGVLAYGPVTPTAQMPTSGSATYAGGFLGFFSNATNSGAITGGNVSLAANFSANTITGSVTGITTALGRSSDNPQFATGTLSNIALTGGTITGNTFAGTAAAVTTVGSTYNFAGTSGAFGGKFYGPAAAEVAGSLLLSGNGNVVMGAFGAKK